jgi:hypothetical protein
MAFYMHPTELTGDWQPKPGATHWTDYISEFGFLGGHSKRYCAIHRDDRESKQSTWSYQQGAVDKRTLARREEQLLRAGKPVKYAVGRQWGHSGRQAVGQPRREWHVWSLVDVGTFASIDYGTQLVPVTSEELDDEYGSFRKIGHMTTQAAVPGIYANGLGYHVPWTEEDEEFPRLIHCWYGVGQAQKYTKNKKGARATVACTSTTMPWRSTKH